MRIIGDIVLAGFGQIKNARIENLASDPGAPQNGQIWFNTTDNVYRGYNGTEVIQFATGGSLQTVIDALAQETLDRQAGDTTLQNNLNAETAARQAADTTLTNNLTAEVNRATAAETTLTNNLNSEISRATAAETTLQNNIDSEASTRAAADTTLQGNIDAEAAARTAADNTLTTNLNAEISARQAADTTLQGNIDAEAAARAAADTAEANTRATADTTLQGNIDSEAAARAAADTAEANARQAADTAEADARIAADTALGARIDALGNAFNYVGGVVGGADAASAFDMDSLAAGGKDAGDYYKVTTAGYFKVGAGAEFYANVGDGLVFNMSGSVDKIDNTDSNVAGTTNYISVTGSTDTGFVVDVATNFKDRVSTLEADLVQEISDRTAADTAEANARSAADTTLQSNIDAEAAARAAADTAEANARTSADATLQSNIDAEAAARTAADNTLTTNLAAEVSRATAAEGVLQSNIDSEASARAAADTTLTNNLNSEISRATAAEGVLQGNIDAEAAARAAADTAEANARAAADTAITTRITDSHVIYDGSTAATSHVVNHGLGVKYCQVTVVDSADKVVIPDAITFNSTTQLTVDFISAITCKVIVSAPKAL